MNGRRIAALLIAVLALVAAGCGGSSSDEASSDTETTVATETTATGGFTIEVSAPGNSDYEYDPVTRTWRFNWKTSSLGPGCYYIQVTSPTSPGSPLFSIRLR